MTEGRSTRAPLRYQRVSKAAVTLLRTEGESGRFEFKQTAAAVGPKVLVAAANWVALDPTREQVTLLVGVVEDKDPVTGLVKGRIVGVPDLDKAIATIQNYARDTQPIPVDITIIEEGTETSKPFLRLEIRPTFAPHYDQDGRRVTRNNASTRPLTDEELLGIYLDREAEKFEQRFERTAGQVMAGVEALAEGIEDLSGDLGSASSAAWEAANNADDSRSVARRLDDTLEDLFDFTEEQAKLTLPGLYFRLLEKRRDVWTAFAADAAARPTKTTDRLIERLGKQLESAIDPNNWAVNLVEVQFWDEVLERRRHQRTMTAWRREIVAREELTLATTISLMNEIEQLRNHIRECRDDD